MKKLNQITNNFYSDEWMTGRKTVKLVSKLLNPSGVICCPFDSSESQFVSEAAEKGSVIFGMRDWLEKDYEYDYLMTNPPFSIKDAVIEKVCQQGKPSALVLPLDSLGGVKRHKLYKEFGYPAIYIPSKRIDYFDSNWVLKKGSNFHSVIMLFNTKWEGILWESIWGQTE